MRQNMAQIQIHDGRIEQKAIEQIKDAADAGKKASGILDARLAFEKRFNQITDDGGGTQNNSEDDGMNPIHAKHFVAEEMDEHEARNRRKNNCAAKAFPRFAGADARDHFVFADQRTDGISAHVAEFCDEDEIEDEIFSIAVESGEKIYFLDEVQQPRHIHQTKQRHGDCCDSGRVGF